MSRRTYLKCSVEECGRNVVAGGLCDLHYRRKLHHGHLEQTRSPDWGAREKHPLYGSWTWMRRKANSTLGHEWKDFWKFVADVSERPSANHYINRKDETKPFGPDNYFWRERIYKKQRNEDQKTYRARYMREYMTTERTRASSLKKNYGISVDEYDAMWEAQDGKCALCRGANEDVIDWRTGKPRMLAVDHCHNSNKVRGLLCEHCNRGLGCFKDDVALIRRAADYVESHQ